MARRLDGEYAFTLDGGTIVAEGLSVGSELGAQDVERLRNLAEERHLLDSALNYLTARPRSRMEVRRRLLQPRRNKPSPAPELVDRVLARLERMHQLDDRDFADYWVEQRERFSPRAGYAMQQELRQRGVDRETAEAATGDENDEERALAAARQRARTIHESDYESYRTKLGSFLLRRGFRYGLAQSVVRQLWEEQRGERPDDDEDAATYRWLACMTTPALCQVRRGLGVRNSSRVLCPPQPILRALSLLASGGRGSLMRRSCRSSTPGHRPLPSSPGPPLRRPIAYSPGLARRWCTHRMRACAGDADANALA